MQCETGHVSVSIPDSSEAVKSIFIAMIEGVRKQAISRGLSDEVAWDRGTQDLSRAHRSRRDVLLYILQGNRKKKMRAR